MTIKKQAYTMAVLPPPPTPGEAVFLPPTAYTPTPTVSFVVPTNIFRLHAVCVGLDGATVQARVLRGGTVLLSSATPLGAGVGGGDGGPAGADSYHNGGGGGAGGYSGNGGNGGTGGANSGWLGSPGGAGNGGGGGGGSGGARGATESGNPLAAGGAGGPVGLLGAGANGAGGTAGGAGENADGKPGSNQYGGPLAGGSPYGKGGNLRWKNDIAVTPGETLTIDLGAWADSASQALGQRTAVRLMWGEDGRSYPNNAGDSVPKGAAVVVLQDTTFTVPPKVYSLSACGQQRNGTTAAVSLVAGGVTVLRAQNGARIGDGGGDGGAAGSGGGGAGGYTGSGGNGGASVNNGDGTFGGLAGAAGAGGAGGGGAGASTYKEPVPVWGGSGGSGYRLVTVPAQPGGGVGISGQGTTGGPGEPGSPDPINGLMGGGDPGQPGGALAWKNDIAVTPGQVITVNAAGGRIRIAWGPGVSYPNNAGG